MLSNNKQIKIICDNIKDLGERKRLINEQREISYEFLLQFFADNYKASDISQSTVLEYTDLIEKYSGKRSNKELINFFCDAVKKIGSSPSIFLNENSSLDFFTPAAPSMISYVKNNHSDSAFIKFSSLFDKPKVTYRTSFEEICEDVYNSVSDYCILPIESSSGGKLFSFYSLIDKYDLKIFAICDLDDGTTDKRTRYALISKKSLIYLKSKKDIFIEFSMIEDKSYSLKNILEAADICGLELYRIDTVSAAYDDLAFKFYHIFKSKSQGILPFLMYLNYKYPRHEAIGYYISI